MFEAKPEDLTVICGEYNTEVYHRVARWWVSAPFKTVRSSLDESGGFKLN